VIALQHKEEEEARERKIRIELSLLILTKLLFSCMCMWERRREGKKSMMTMQLLIKMKYSE
jgi:hypothetical protein